MTESADRHIIEVFWNSDTLNLVEFFDLAEITFQITPISDTINNLMTYGVRQREKFRRQRQ